MSKARSISKYLFVLLFITSIVAFLRYPYLVNSSYYLSSIDESPHAWLIKSLMDGAPLFFYFSDKNYHGITIGLAAIPFFWLLGVNALAYKLPAIIFHSIYLLTSYFVAKKINKNIGLLVVFLMLLAPQYVFYISFQNWPHHLVALLGNVIFLIVMTLKTPGKKNKKFLIFSLSLIMGLAVYTYTYSIVFLFTVLVVFILTHESWPEIRLRIWSLKLKNLFDGATSLNLKIARVLDTIIFFFILAILFSYIFGGFGLDIAGESIFQINNLHKPALQLIALIVLRCLIYRNDLISKKKRCAEYIKKIDPETKSLIFLFFGGFIIGIFPRILSIISGQVKRGGEGFDLDFSPIKLADHFYGLFTYSFPELFGLRKYIYTSVTDGISSSYTLAMTIASLAILCLFLTATFSFFATNIKSCKNIFLGKSIDYKPELILITLFITVCAANIISQTGPIFPRYIYPLYMVLIIWASLYIIKIKKRSFAAFILILTVWAGFYLTDHYQGLKDGSLIKDLQVIKKKEPLFDVIKFCRENKINLAYGDFTIVYKANFLSNNSPFFVEYLTKPKYYGSNYFQNKANLSKDQSNFAIITSSNNMVLGNPDSLYLNFLKNNDIEFNKVSMDDHTIYFDFKGPSLKVNELRTLMSDHYNY
jgi:hypothetical protein